MIKVGICDDSVSDRKELLELIERYFAEDSRKTEIVEYDSGEEFFQSGEVDILFLDIEMAKMSGIDVKNRLQREQIRTRIVFITSHDEMMEDAFGKQVFGFLRKPIEYEKLKEKLELVLEDMDEEYQVVFTGLGEEHCVYKNRILYIKANGKYSDIILEKEEKYFSDRSIGEWRKELESRDFFLSHKSYLVNLYHIRQIKDEIILLSGEHVPVSRRMKSATKDAYRNYIRRKAR